MTPLISSCDLCGLPLPQGMLSFVSKGRTLGFCCNGCRQVYRMLSETSDLSDPDGFRDTELFKRCLEMGIIPRSEAELAQRSRADLTSALNPKVDRVDGVRVLSQKAGNEHMLPLSLSIEGMWCPSCSWFIEEAFRKCAGIINLSCNFTMDRLRCEYDPVITSPSRIMDDIHRLGYMAHLPQDTIKQSEDRKEFFRFSISAFLTANVMMLSFALYSGFFTPYSQNMVRTISWPILVMAGFVLFYGGAGIFRRALAGLTRAAYSMETLISIAALSAFVFSCHNFMIGSVHQYFDTAGMLITLVLLGKLLERRAKDKVQGYLDDLYPLISGKVRICTPTYPDGRYMNIACLKKGDIFQVEPNEIFPADGVIQSGRGTVDESSLTGEALQVRKKPGDRVKSATRATGGIFRIKAEAVGDDSVVGQMIRIIEGAVDGKIPIEARTDLILRWFVPIIVFLAIATIAVSMGLGLSAEYAMIRGITVLVISCPCALGIAIPLARVAGVSLAGKKGFLVRRFSAFSRVQKVDTFVFDKTGTLTTGGWSLLSIACLGSLSEDQVLAMAGALERDSDHPVAMNIKGEARTRGLNLPVADDIQYFKNSVIATIGGKEIKIGSKAFLFIDSDQSMSNFSCQNFPWKEPDPGEMVSRVYMSFDGSPCAIFMFGDRIRESAFSVTERLRSSGYHLTLVSGDGDITTKEVAMKLGIEDAHGGMLPQDKAKLINRLKEQGYCVAMVGDGLNDAPAMAASDMSFAIYNGKHPAKESADVTLMHGDPARIPDFFRMSSKVNQKILQNLLLSFVYNALSIPAAVIGLMNPLIAVCAMLMSSLTVIGNTILLVRDQEFRF